MNDENDKKTVLQHELMEQLKLKYSDILKDKDFMDGLQYAIKNYDKAFKDLANR